jgi:four helix bundle protein
MDLVVEIYRVTTAFPRHETYGLAVQSRKAAVSVPANVAEGHGREHLGDYIHHLSIANGSLMELETHCLIAERLRYITQEDVAPLLKRTGELGRMLAGLIRALKRRRTPRHLTPGT